MNKKIAIPVLGLGLALVLGARPVEAQRSQAATLSDIQKVEYDQPSALPGVPGPGG
jgi:hypothetical protein